MSGHHAGGRRSALRGERGSATVELAVGLVAVVLVLLSTMTGVSAVVTRLECVDAARQAARAEARGESGETAGRRAAPAGASVVVTVDGDLVRATVRSRSRALGGLVPQLSVSATAVAQREPGITS